MDRFLFADDLSAEQTWILVDWCARHGATEFAVERLGLQGQPTPYVDRFEAEMAPFRLPPQPRPRMSRRTRDDLIRPTDLWSLSEGSVLILRRYFSGGLFMYPTSEWSEGCFEDPTIYRNDDIVVGITTHEREGILSAGTHEHAMIAALGIVTRDHPQWL